MFFTGSVEFGGKASRPALPKRPPIGFLARGLTPSCAARVLPLITNELDSALVDPVNDRAPEFVGNQRLQKYRFQLACKLSRALWATDSPATSGETF